MDGINIHDFGKFQFMATMNGGGKRYFDLYGEILLIRKKYIIIEDNEENGYKILKGDLKSFKQEKRKQ